VQDFQLPFFGQGIILQTACVQYYCHTVHSKNSMRKCSRCEQRDTFWPHSRNMATGSLCQPINLKLDNYTNLFTSNDTYMTVLQLVPQQSTLLLSSA